MLDSNSLESFKTDLNFKYKNSIDEIIGKIYEIRLHEDRIIKLIQENPFDSMKLSISNFKRLIDICYGKFTNIAEINDLIRIRFKNKITTDQFIERYQNDTKLFYLTLKSKL